MALATSMSDALSSLPVPPISGGQLQDTSAQTSSETKKDSDRAAANQHDQDISSVNTAIADRDKYEKEGRPAFPTLDPEPKQQETNDPVKGYVSAIGILGAIGSMFTRAPMTNAMNAASATLNSMKAGDDAAFKKNYETWKTHNDNALKLFDYQNDTYKAIMGDKNKSVDERISEMKANAAAFKDDLMLKLLEERNPAIINEATAKADLARGQLAESQDKINEWKERQDLWKQWVKENPEATAEQKASQMAKIFNPSAAAAAVRAQATADKTATKNKEGYDSAITQIDELIGMAQKGGGLGVTGLAGLAERGKETVETMVPAGANAATPASDFQSKIDALKLQLPKLMTGASKSAVDERAKVDQILRGVSAGDTKAKTINSLKQLKAEFKKRANEEDEESAYNIGDVVTDPDGTKHKITGFDADGTPLGDPVE